MIIGLQVCGENGISYENECMLRKENCENNKRVKVEHRGLCSKYIETESILKKIQDQICLKKQITRTEKSACPLVISCEN